MAEPITTKKEMYRRLNAGLLGYTLPAVESPAEVADLVATGGLFALRLKQSGGLTRFNLTPEQIRDAIRSMSPGSWNVTPMLDDAFRVCYGHLTDEPGGWRLHYSPDPKPCKLLPYQDGCREMHRVGLDARMYLRGIMAVSVFAITSSNSV